MQPLPFSGDRDSRFHVSGGCWSVNSTCSHPTIRLKTSIFRNEGFNFNFVNRDCVWHQASISDIHTSQMQSRIAGPWRFHGSHDSPLAIFVNTKLVVGQVTINHYSTLLSCVICFDFLKICMPCPYWDRICAQKIFLSRRRSFITEMLDNFSPPYKF